MFMDNVENSEENKKKGWRAGMRKEKLRFARGIIQTRKRYSIIATTGGKILD